MSSANTQKSKYYNTKRNRNRRNKNNNKAVASKGQVANLEDKVDAIKRRQEYFAKNPKMAAKINNRRANNVNRVSNRTGGLAKFVEGMLTFAQVPMPRPIPMPVASYVFSKTLEFNSPGPGADYEGLIEVNPYMDDQVVISSKDYDKDSATYVSYSYPANSIMTSLYYARNNFDRFKQKKVILMPPYCLSDAPSTAATVYWCRELLGFANQKGPSYSYVPNYRNPTELDLSHGALPYINFSNNSDHPEIAYAVTIDGNAKFTPTLKCYQFEGEDLQGSLINTTTFTVTTLPASHNSNFSATFALEATANSAIFELEGFEDISFIRWSGGAIDAGKITTIRRFSNCRVVTMEPEQDTEFYQNILSAASGYAITGIAATLTNTSPPSYAGGTCASALLPDDVSVPNSYSGYYEQISTRPYYKYLGVAATGCHAIWIPEDISELKIFEKSEYLRSNRITLGFKSSGSQGANPSWKLVLSFRMELQLNTQLVPTYIPPSSVNFLPALFSAIRENLQEIYGENPSHMQRIKKVAQKIAKNPQFRSAVKDIGTAAFNGLVQCAVKGLSSI